MNSYLMQKSSPIPKITVFGSGSFGTAIAHLLARKGLDVLIWGRDPKVVREINSRHTNLSYLKNIPLAPFRATHDLDEATSGRTLFLFAIPCQFIRPFLLQIKKKLPKSAILVNLAKGIEIESLKIPSQIFSEILGPDVLKRYAMISGPTFAEELCHEMPTGAAVASTSLKTARFVQETLSLRFFRLYRARDCIGVELGGALKNVMAIGVGIADGLGFGQNTRAGLITRCLREMTELGVAMGAHERTFSGLSGIGDLILTCTGNLSRNRQVGLALGKGKPVKTILRSMKHVAEGVPTAKSVNDLRRKHGIIMPNAEHVYKILYEGMSAREAVNQILSRELKAEF